MKELSSPKLYTCIKYEFDRRECLAKREESDDIRSTTKNNGSSTHRKLQAGLRENMFVNGSTKRKPWKPQ